MIINVHEGCLNNILNGPLLIMIIYQEGVNYLNNSLGVQEAILLMEPVVCQQGLKLLENSAFPLEKYRKDLPVHHIFAFPQMCQCLNILYYTNIYI